MKILITGLGITGKSTFRKLFAQRSAVNGLPIWALDLDYERDKIPREENSDIVYVYEDVHGPTKKAVIPLPEYDLIFYLLPSWLTHLRFWLSRMNIWFQNGKFAWDADKSKGEWAGTRKPYDLRNIPGIVKYFWHHFAKRNQEIKKDFEVMRKAKIPVIIVEPIKAGGKIYFRLIEGAR